MACSVGLYKPKSAIYCMRVSRKLVENCFSPRHWGCVKRKMSRIFSFRCQTKSENQHSAGKSNDSAPHILKILSWNRFMRSGRVVKQQAASTTRQKSETMKNYSKGAVNLDVFNIEWKKKIKQEKLCTDSHTYERWALAHKQQCRRKCWRRMVQSLIVAFCLWNVLIEVEVHWVMFQLCF